MAAVGPVPPATYPMRLPRVVAAFFQAPRPDEASAAFAGDALYAWWDGSDDETAARATARGADAIRRALASGGPRPEPVVCIHDGSDCFVEGRLSTAAGARKTFVASLQLNAGGEIARFLSFHRPEVPASSPWSAGMEAPPARPVLDRYFHHLTAGEFRHASHCFSEDCVYSHPPYHQGAPHAEFRGRAELLAGFEQRGMRPARPAIVRCLQRGPECFIEGVVDGVEDGGSFVSALSLDRDGRIRRYVAFYCAPRVPRRERGS